MPVVTLVITVVIYSFFLSLILSILGDSITCLCFWAVLITSLHLKALGTIEFIISLYIEALNASIHNIALGAIVLTTSLHIEALGAVLITSLHIEAPGTSIHNTTVHRSFECQYLQYHYIEAFGGPILTT